MKPADGPTPRLRFPEFRNAGPWEVKRLGELVTTITPPKKLQTTEYQPSGRFPIIDQSPNAICGWTDDESALVEADFPVVIFGDHSCVVKLADFPFAQGADGIKILSPAENIDGQFLFLLLEASPIEQKGYNRHFSELKEKLIPFPLKASGEQQKIADCLSSLDALIRAEGERLGVLKNHKRGLMQRLFPRPGETIPRLRFPEFRDAGPWEVKRLGELVTTITPPKKLQTTEYQPSGRFPIIDQSPNAICGWTDDESALVEADFPVVIFGDHSCVVKLADFPFAQGADGIKILSPAEKIDGQFLFLLLEASPIEQKGYNRHFSELNEKLIPFPLKASGEQQKIAHCLTSLDDLIQAQGARVEALKAYKRGLMQRLFPQEAG